MEAIIEGIAALVVLIAEAFIHLIAVVAELVGWVLVWVCGPFWSDDKKSAGLSEKWKQVIKRLVAVVLLVGFGMLCWWGWEKLSPKEAPPTVIHGEDAKEAAKRAMRELIKSMEETKNSKP